MQARRHAQKAAILTLRSALCSMQHSCQRIHRLAGNMMMYAHVHAMLQARLHLLERLVSLRENDLHTLANLSISD